MTDDKLRAALDATLRRDDLCDETDGEHHTDEYVAAFLGALDTKLRGRSALAASATDEGHVGPHFVGEFDKEPRSRSCPACARPAVPEALDVERAAVDMVAALVLDGEPDDVLPALEGALAVRFGLDPEKASVADLYAALRSKEPA